MIVFCIKKLPNPNCDLGFPGEFRKGGTTYGGYAVDAFRIFEKMRYIVTF